MEKPSALRNILIYVAVIALFGVVVPAGKGLTFFDPVLLAAYACMSILFAGPAAAQAFETHPRSLAEAVRWIVKAALFGEALSIAMLLCGILTVYLRSHGVFFAPDLQSLGYAVLLGFAASLALASIAAWASVRLSASGARIALRVVYFALVIWFYFDGRWLPSIVEVATVFCLLAAAVFVALLRMRLAMEPAKS